MKQTLSAIALAKQELNKIKINDPIVKVEANSLILLPQYFSYRFVSLYFFMIIPFILLFAQQDTKYHLGAAVIIFGVIYIFFSLLKSSNTVHIDTDSKKLTVKPPAILKPIKKKKIISFKDIDRFDFKDNGASPGEKRFIIFFESNKEVTYLTSTSSEKNSLALLKIIRLLMN